MGDEDEDFEEEAPEDPELEMELGKKDEDIYEETGREELLDDDEIEAWEEGFMAGAEGEGQGGKCKQCGKALTPDETIEHKVGDHILKFCSDLCAEAYEEELEEED
ncbi:hypothetical protein J4439_05275 [Candidatus Woesearchaeota archaeon]|nr:hypothetical protein [Candidatus Woesearchaeota archaeon]